MAVAKKEKPLLHIITPVYNEGDNFPALYDAVKKNVKIPHKLVVVYDFDEDTTVPVAKSYAAKDKTVILHKNTIGRGPMNALKSGFDYVKDGPILVTMADLSDDLGDADVMYKKYLDGAQVVCASRYVKGGKQIGGPLFKRRLTWLAGASLHYVRGVPTHDLTNNFRLYDKALLDRITIESTGGFEIAMEITVKAFALRVPIAEIPTTWRDRTAGQSNFKLWKWLPSYLKWYFVALKPRVPKKST
jgi:dolichol-phosphate mannosyltransferase